MRDGRTKQWDRSAVEGWLDANAQRLGRHRSEAPRRLSESHSIPLSFEKALRAAERVSEGTGAPFDVHEELASIQVKLANAFREQGVGEAIWDGSTFNFHFVPSECENENRLLFLLTYA
jgi:hypothetical protein